MEANTSCAAIFRRSWRAGPAAAAAALALLLAAAAAAQAPVPKAQAPPATSPAAPAAHLTLARAIELALQHNHALLAARTTVDQSRANEITANLRPNPVLTGDAMFIPYFQPSAFNSSFINQASEFDLGVSYLFERGKKRQHRLQAARDLTAVASATLGDDERILTSNVAQQFIGVLLAESNLQLAQMDLASFQNTVQISESRYQAGDISEGDLLKIKLQLLQFQMDLNAARLARVQALAALRQLVGFESVPANYAVDGQLAYQPVSLGLDDLEAMALRDRPDLLAARLGVTAAQSQHSLAIANGKRDLTMTFDYTHVSAANTGTTFFNIEMPIFDRNQGEIARTNFAVTQTQQDEQAASETVLTDVTAAYENLHTADQVVRLYTSGYLNEAQESRDISNYAFQRGSASLLDYLDAERSYRATELAYRQALASYMLALEQLRQAVGTRSLP
jgi:outer membrane protein, heavy metal efflux system